MGNISVLKLEISEIKNNDRLLYTKWLLRKKWFRENIYFTYSSLFLIAKLFNSVESLSILFERLFFKLSTGESK